MLTAAMSRTISYRSRCSAIFNNHDFMLILYRIQIAAIEKSHESTHGSFTRYSPQDYGWPLPPVAPYT